jgi:Cu(I)/Ag(I) efflux system membrane fusion protein
VIPASAPLITGTRAIVYVQQPDISQYEGRQVVLGPRAGAYYIVKEGLQEGESVVTNGSFKIDADLQIQGKPSMMNPHGGTPTGGHAH